MCDPSSGTCEATQLAQMQLKEMKTIIIVSTNSHTSIEYKYT